MKVFSRISRPCYDKRHRCPGWAGGGMKSAKIDRCDGGYVDHPSTLSMTGKYSMFEFGRCRKCNVLVLPDVVRKFDPAWLSWRIPYLLSWHFPYLSKYSVEKLKQRWDDYKSNRS